MEKEKVLIVDDVPNLLKLGKAIFQTGGYDVVTATDGVDALHALSLDTITLIVTDILMPNMDGYSLCYHIRNNEKTKNIPIIVYSATYISQSDEDLALEIGADMFIRKPASMNYLLNAARELISQPKEHIKVNHRHELTNVTRQYSSRLVEKLEDKNLELEKAQDDLAKSEKRFRALIENNFDAITLKDKKGKVIYQSPATERMVGYRNEESAGKNATDFFHPGDIADVLKRMETAIKNPGMPIYGINRMRHKDGHYIWIEGTTTNLLGDENVTAIVGNFRDITERKLAEEKINRSKANLKAIFENSSESLFLTDTDGIILEFNTNAKETNLLTFDKDLQIGAHIQDYIATSRKELFKEMMSRVLAGAAIQYDQSFTAIDGSYHCFDFSISPVKEYGVINGLCFSGREITERKLAEEKIINGSRLYAFISGINQLIVHAADEDTVFKESCRIAIEVGKFKMAWIGLVDTVQKKVNLVESKGITHEDAVLFANVHYSNNDPQYKVISTGSYYVCNDVENDLETASWKPFAAKYALRSCMVLPIKRSGIIIGTLNLYASELNLFNPQEILLLEEIAGDISFALDVFEKEKNRKIMKDKLIRSELQLKQAQAIAHFGSWDLDFATGMAVWSDEACRIYGFAVENNIHSYETWLSFIHPEDLAYVMKITSEKRDTLTGAAFYHRIIRKDGTVRHLYSQAEFEFDKEGKPVGLNGVAHDVTEQKTAEAERNKMMADIVQRNKNLEQFSYAVSHNLRAPVANILGIADIMQTIDLNKEDEKISLHYLDIAVKKLDNIVIDLNDILTIKHEISEKKIIVNFSGILSDVKISIDNVIRNEQVKIIGDFTEIDELVTLKSYLHSIFFNLISNSIKYKQPDIPPLIEITGRKAKNKIQLLFKDNGLGIDLKKRGSEVFGIYKRFHHHVEGKGLGLYMVKTQVEALGGTITIASEVNKGTEFRIEFENNA